MMIQSCLGIIREFKSEENRRHLERIGYGGRSAMSLMSCDLDSVTQDEIIEAFLQDQEKSSTRPDIRDMGALFAHVGLQIQSSTNRYEEASANVFRDSKVLTLL